MIMANSFNTYNVTFIFPYLTVGTTVMAMHEDAAETLAVAQIEADFPLRRFLSEAEDVCVELLDADAYVVGGA